MSFRKNEFQQLNFDDSFLLQTPRTQKIIENSWAADFAENVYPAIHEEHFAALYSDNPASRPNAPVNVIVGALILKESRDISDDELVESICCDVRFQYALHTTSYAEQPVSDRTFSRFRERLYNYELETGHNLLVEEMESLADIYAQYAGRHANVKNIDGLMIAFRCTDMSRLEMVYRAAANAVRLIHLQKRDDLLSPDLLHYLDAEDYNHMVRDCKGENILSHLRTVLQDAAAVKKLMADDEWHDFTEYQLLLRILHEQPVSDAPHPGEQETAPDIPGGMQDPETPQIQPPDEQPGNTGCPGPQSVG